MLGSLGKDVVWVAKQTSSEIGKVTGSSKLMNAGANAVGKVAGSTIDMIGAGAGAAGNLANRMITGVKTDLTSTTHKISGKAPNFKDALHAVGDVDIIRRGNGCCKAISSSCNDCCKGCCMCVEGCMACRILDRPSTRGSWSRKPSCESGCQRCIKPCEPCCEITSACGPVCDAIGSCLVCWHCCNDCNDTCDCLVVCDNGCCDAVCSVLSICG